MTNVESFRRPELFLADLLKRYAQGELEQGRSLFRAVVLAVDVDGGMLQGTLGESVEGVDLGGRPKSYGSIVGPRNPRNSIKAMLLSDGVDSFFSEEQARVFWPFFPPDQVVLPIAPGEHVYVMFEDLEREHGLWFSRVSGHDDPNFLKGSDKLETSREAGRRDLNSLIDGRPTEPAPYRTDDAASTGAGSGRDLNSIFGD